MNSENDFKNNAGVESDENMGMTEMMGENEADDDDVLFNSLIDQLGKTGKYQIRINYLYNLIYVMLVMMPFSNFILAMSVPDHWCYVPGRELTNYTAVEWKEKWVPKEKRLQSEKDEFNACKMYNLNETGKTEIIGKCVTTNTNEEFFSSHNAAYPANHTPKIKPMKAILILIDCQYGWEYDRQWFSDTAPTSQNWVCDRAWLTTHALTATNVGEVIGIFVLGQLGDLIGRRPIFYTSLAILIIGRVSLVYTAHNYGWFLVFMGLGTAVMGSAVTSPLVISVEVSPDSRQNHILFLQNLGGIIGNFALPFIAWMTKDWRTYLLVTSFPCGIYFFLYKLLPESPRWLANKGKITEARQVLEDIAKTNQTKVLDNMNKVLKKIGSRKEKFTGMATLFQNWRLAKNAIILAICGVTNGLSSYAIILNATNMEGNPFMNYFWAMASDIPSNLVIKAVGEYLPRRWSAVCCFFFASMGCLLLIIFYEVEIPGLQNFFVAAIRLNLSWAGYMTSLQSLGIYPTCIRETGLSFGSIIVAAVGTAGPYIIYLGTNFDARIPFIAIFFLTLNAAICSSFLPETLNEKLPETLKDSYVFGKNQKFWSFSLNREKKPTYS